MLINVSSCSLPQLVLYNDTDSLKLDNNSIILQMYIPDNVYKIYIMVNPCVSYINLTIC
jgi:hypothetical protein